MPRTVLGWTGRLGDAWHRMVGPRHGPRVVVTSIPKSGTHLVISALRSVPRMRVCPGVVLGNVSTEDRVRRIARLGPRQVLVAHFVYDQQVARALSQRGAKLVLMVRDPRDVVVSLSKYILREKVRHRYYEYFTQALQSDGDRLMACIRGVGPEHARDGREMPDVGSLFRRYLAWEENHETHVCRFENLVGAHGGGSDEVQVEEVGALFRFLGLGTDESLVHAVAGATFSTRSRTFRKGEIGDWRRHFTPEHRAAFREVAGSLLVDLGYEKDGAW